MVDIAEQHVDTVVLIHMTERRQIIKYIKTDRFSNK